MVPVLLFKYLRYIADERTRDLPLVGPPWAMLAILALYLLLVKKCLPKFMENRAAFDCKFAIKCYNVIQILINAYVCIGVRKSYKLHLN